MLSAVPVARLLDGVAAALQTHVQPHVTDRFALMQLRAIDEVLRNLAERVDSSMPEVTQETDEIQRILEALRQAGWSGEAATGGGSQAESGPAGAAELHRRSQALFALREALNWVEQLAVRDETANAARHTAIESLRAAIARERALLKSGMYA